MKRLGLFAFVTALGLLGCNKHAESDRTKVVATASEADVKGQARTTADSPAPTPAQLERKKKSIALVTSMGLPTLDTLPVVEDAAAIKARPVEEISGRCRATFLCALKGELNDAKLVEEVAAQLATKDLLSPAEKTFIEAASPPKQDLSNFAWRYECVHVFLWALGFVPDLGPANHIADVEKEAAIVREQGAEGLTKNAKVRPLAEILDQNDLYYRIHWAATELELKNEKNPAVDGEIVEERHRALNWLIRYQNQAWDDVTTDT